MLYFIQDQTANLIKIGYTSGDDAEVRLKALQTGSPIGLVILLTAPGARQEEAELHRRFSSARVHGEWFRPVPELMLHIIQLAQQAATSSHPPPESDEALPRWPLSIYLAGKIRKHDWRQSIVTDIDYEGPGTGCCPGGEPVALPDSWPVSRGAIFGVHDYTGPYFQRCDHGCFHGEDSHGTAAQSPDYDEDAGGSRHGDIPLAGRVVSLCLEAIDHSDLIFAWIEDPTCYGTLFEIGYATAMGKQVWLAFPGPGFRDFWFLMSSAHGCVLPHQPNPAQALRRAVGVIAHELNRSEIDRESTW